MRHAILGPGGVGGLIAASLSKSGAAVTLVVRGEAIGRYPDTLQLESPFGKFTVRVDRTTTVPAVDVLWIAVKATQLDSALGSLPNGNSARAIIPLLNGIDHVAMLRSRYGTARIVPATISVESERTAPGHILHRSPFARLSVSSIGRTLMQGALEDLQRLGFTCQFIEDEQTLLWASWSSWHRWHLQRRPHVRRRAKSQRSAALQHSQARWLSLRLKAIWSGCQRFSAQIACSRPDL